MLGPTPPHHIGVLTHKMLPGDHHDDDVDDYDCGYICTGMMILILMMTQNEDVCLPESRKTDRDDVLLENHVSSESEVEMI